MDPDQPTVISADVVIAAPTASDGKRMWRIANDAASLDLNSSYAYLLWSSHFSATSAVAKVGDQVIGFATGFIPPDQPDSLMIWQIAVDEQFRGRGIGLALLDSVLKRNRHRTQWLKATVGRSNTASAALFTAFADQHLAILSRTLIFSTADFPDSHEPEELYVIGPFND
ncbi:MAG: diaminobutyrate acetyltransferase [Nocardiaceae bacterium]|nr:diaminobutyrate acetyltransferase [Nocardiaceae bacterium]